MALLIGGLVVGSAAAQEPVELTGPARVMDADILAIGSKRIILWGVDAPERNQTCSLQRRQWACWNVAARELQILVADGDTTCKSVGKADAFGRIYGVCTSNGKNLNEEMVRSGLALAFTEQTDDYTPAQEEAKAAKAGLWQDTAKFMPPWIFRFQRGARGAR
jgi:endonuclease YncB( thermonuclease family)